MVQIITPSQLFNKLNEGPVCVLDVRSTDKYAINHLKHKNAEGINIPKNNIFNIKDIDTNVNLALSKEKEIVVTCTTGNSAKKCATILSEKGYQVTLLEGGMTAWNNMK